MSEKRTSAYGLAVAYNSKAGNEMECWEMNSNACFAIKLQCLKEGKEYISENVFGCFVPVNISVPNAKEQ